MLPLPLPQLVCHDPRKRCHNHGVCSNSSAERLWLLRLQDFYGLTLDALKEAQNDRLWFKTQLKLCGLWFKLKEYSRGARILRELHRCCAQLCRICRCWSPCDVRVLSSSALLVAFPSGFSAGKLYMTACQTAMWRVSAALGRGISATSLPADMPCSLTLHATFAEWNILSCA